MIRKVFGISGAMGAAGLHVWGTCLADGLLHVSAGTRTMVYGMELTSGALLWCLHIAASAFECAVFLARSEHMNSKISVYI